MADPKFSDPQLARLYDVFDADRSDLDPYEAAVEELDARSVLDVGCGTGVLALRLAARGLRVVGLDPAAASLDVARAKPGSSVVTWIEGDATALAEVSVDLAVLTGNVAQAILGADWPTTLAGVRGALVPGGYLLLESRVPAARAWDGWTPESTRTRREVPGVGPVDAWCEVLAVTLPLVSFRWHYAFPGGLELTSDSTLAFRTEEELVADLESAGFVVLETRDAADRPGLEHVLLARHS